MTRILVTGSVGYDDRALIFTTLDAIVRLAGGEIVTIVHADVEGAESIAGQIARDGAESGLVDEPWPWSGDDTMDWRPLMAGCEEVLAFFGKGQNGDQARSLLLLARHLGIEATGNYDWSAAP